MILLTHLTQNIAHVWCITTIKHCTSPQAVEDVNRGVCVAGARLYQLKALQEVRRAPDYLALARTLPGYGDIAFPPARTDCRATPVVAITVGE